MEPEAEHPEPSTQNPAPQHLAPQHEASIWPAVVAAGLTVAMFGLIANSASFSVLGVVALAAGIAGWVGELYHAHEHP